MQTPLGLARMPWDREATACDRAVVIVLCPLWFECQQHHGRRGLNPCVIISLPGPLEPAKGKWAMDKRAATTAQLRTCHTKMSDERAGR